MKSNPKFFIFTLPFFILIAAMMTSCNDGYGYEEGYRDGINNGVQKFVVGPEDLYVNEGDWEEFKIDGVFDHYFYDFDMPELSYAMLNSGFFHTYWVQEDGDVEFQEGTGVLVYGSYLDQGSGQTVYYSINLTVEYSLGSMRVCYRPSDFDATPPTGTHRFRFVAFY